MRIINQTDQQQIAWSIESASRELISEILSLAERSGDNLRVAINMPTLVRIRKRLTSDVRGEEQGCASAAVGKRTSVTYTIAGFQLLTYTTPFNPLMN